MRGRLPVYPIIPGESKRERRKRLARERNARKSPEEKRARHAKGQPYQREWRKRNPEKTSVYCRKHRATNLEKKRESCRSHKWTKHGMSRAEYFTMLVVQSGQCKICLQPLPGGHHTHIDHCHKTGKVRGVLCMNCNHMLGKSKDNPEILMRGAQYLIDSDGDRSC